MNSNGTHRITRQPQPMPDVTRRDLQRGLNEVYDLLADDAGATVTCARLALALSGMEEAGLVRPPSERDSHP